MIWHALTDLSENCKYGADLAKQFVGSLHNVLKTCGSVRISFSRRTPQKVQAGHILYLYHTSVQLVTDFL
jgi:mitochondrial fission protein ELM1